MCTLVHDKLMNDVRRLFGTHDAQWLPSTPDEMRENHWIAAIANEGADRGKVISALTYLRGTAGNRCCVTGICTDAAHRRKGYARRLLRELLRTRPGCEITVDLPLRRTGAVAFFKHYLFEALPGPFACPGGSVQMILLDRAIQSE